MDISEAHGHAESDMPQEADDPGNQDAKTTKVVRITTKALGDTSVHVYETAVVTAFPGTDAAVDVPAKQIESIELVEVEAA